MVPPACAILLAAGAGTRLAAGRPKALVEIAGRPLVAWSAAAIAATAEITASVLVVPQGAEGEEVAGAARAAGLSPEVVTGGARRRDSVAAGLAAVEHALVVVHDAARPLAGPGLFARLLATAAEKGAAIPALPVADTLVRVAGDLVDEPCDRAEILAVQTPQAFRTDLLRRAHAEADPAWDAPDDGAMVRRLGHSVHVVAGDPANRKLTWSGEIPWFEAMLAGRAAR